VARRIALLLAVALCVATAPSAASAQPAAVGQALVKVRMPNDVGLRMDRATRLLHSKGLRVNEECTGLLGCIIKSNWWICGQAPRAGKLMPKFSVVTIFGARRGEC
jgi:hypothetical protein